MRRSLWAMSCLALAMAAHVSAQQFTYNAAALPAQNVWTDGVGLIDVDGDGDIDILFANGSVYGGTGVQGAAAQHLFLNNGSGIFSAAHAQLNVANFNAKMVIGEDFDDDGDPDLMYASGSTGSPPRILINDGTGNFADETATRIPVLALRSFCVCAGDVDDDGDLDVVVTDGGTFGGTASQARLLKNDGAGNFTDVTGAQMPADLYNCQDVTLLDMDGDFDLDIALSGKGGAGKQGRLYLNDGAGNFSINSVMNAIGTGATYEVDYGDLDADSDFDAAVQSISSQSEGWARNDGTGTPMVKTTFPTPNGNDDNEMVCMDYNNDGLLDVFVGNLGFQEKCYRNNGGGSFTNVNAIIQVQADSTLDMGTADLNGDGKYDLVTGQGESGNFLDKVYMNSGTADTLAPVLVDNDIPGALGDPETVFHIRLRDQISDDGHIGVTVSYVWSTIGADAGGSGDALHQGSGQYRAAVPTPTGTTSAEITFTATDGAGNSAVFGPYTVGAGDPWTDLGGGLAGVSGIPVLVGTGPLTTGSAGTLSLTSAAPSSLSSLFLSLSSTPTPFKCGTLLTVPIAFQFLLFTNGSGAIPLSWPSWPAGLSGASVYFQYAIADGAAVCSTSLSNAVRGDVP